MCLSTSRLQHCSPVRNLIQKTQALRVRKVRQFCEQIIPLQICDTVEKRKTGCEIGFGLMHRRQIVQAVYCILRFRRLNFFPDNEGTEIKLLCASKVTEVFRN